MTRKDYEAIAKALNGLAFSADKGASSRAIADVMARDNPRFDRERFLKACGI